MVIILIMIIAIAVGNIYNEEGKTVPTICALKTSMPPQIDGIIDPVWTSAPVYGTFFLPDGSTPEAKTTIRLLYDDDNFYIFYECDEPLMDKLDSKVYPHDGPVWTGDSVDFFLIPFPGPQPIAYHFIANPAGSTYDEKILYPRKEDNKWNASWKAAGIVDLKKWTVEISIPWSDLGVKNLVPGNIIEGNFGRMRKPKSEISAIIPTSGFQNIERRTRIRLVSESGWVGVTSFAVTEDSTAGTLAVNCTVISPEMKHLLLKIKTILPSIQVLSVSQVLAKKDTPVSTVGMAGNLKDKENFSFVVEIVDKNTHEAYYISPVMITKSFQKSILFEPDQYCYYPGEQVILSISSVLKGSWYFSVRDPNGKILYEQRVKGSPPEKWEVPGEVFNSPGIYIAVASLNVEGGEIHNVEVPLLVVQKPSWPKIEVKKVDIRKEDGTLMVNGEPFFPVEIYHTEETDYPEIVYLGFNTVIAGWKDTPQEIRAQLDKCAAVGLLANVGLPDRGYGDRLGKRENVIAKVLAVKDHPALLMYHLLDEPKVSYYSTLKLGYELVKSLDPNHPQYCTLPTFLNYPESILDEAARTRDIIAPDIYPFDYYPVTAVYDAVKICVDTARRSSEAKGVVYVGPCFEWLPHYRLPLPEEARLIAYLAIIAGANGLGWYSYRETGLERTKTGFGLHAPEATKLRTSFKRLNSEMAILAPALCAPAPKQEVVTNPKVFTVFKEGNTAFFLIVANPAKEQKEVTIHISGIPDAKAEVLNEFRTVQITQGIIKDTFGPMDVHVYIIPKQGG